MENAWIKHTRQRTASHNVDISTEINEYFCGDSAPYIILFRTFKTELKAKYDAKKAKNANIIVLTIKFYFSTILNLTLNFYV